MAFELHRRGFPGIAASTIQAGQAVSIDVGDTQRQFVPVTTATGVEPFGIVIGTAVNPGDGVTVYERGNVVKVLAAASLGAGVDVAATPSVGRYDLVSTGSGVLKWSVGKSMTAAAAGEVFSLYVNPRGNTPIT